MEAHCFSDIGMLFQSAAGTAVHTLEFSTRHIICTDVCGPLLGLISAARVPKRIIRVLSLM